MLHGTSTGSEADFRWLLLSATLATIVGAVLIPTFQRLFSKAVVSFSRYRSVPRLLLAGISPAGLLHLRDSLRVPSWANVTQARRTSHIPWHVIVLNVLAMGIWTVGVFSALYAGYLRPELRVTASQLSAIINGGATILMFVVIDPHLSMLTDEFTEGKISEPYFRRSIVWLTGSRLAGTILAQVLLIPAALWIVMVADWL